MFLGERIGIDIGTTVTRICIRGRGVVAECPSCVAYDSQSGEVVAIGKEARQLEGRGNESVKTISPIEGRILLNYQYALPLIRNVVQYSLTNFSFVKPDAILAIHSSSTPAQQRAFKDCLCDAGIRNVHSEPIPILAARGAEIPLEDTDGRVIVDIGASTLNIAVVAYGGIVQAKTFDIGGKTLDLAIAEHLEKKYGVRIGMQSISSIKRTIGSAILVKTERVQEVSGFIVDSKTPVIVQITTNDIAEALISVIQDIENAISEVINTVPTEMASDITNFGIMLCGGTSQLNFLPTLLTKRLGVEVCVAKDPSRCVIKGAKMLLQELDTHKDIILAKTKK